MDGRYVVFQLRMIRNVSQNELTILDIEIAGQTESRSRSGERQDGHVPGEIDSY